MNVYIDCGAMNGDTLNCEERFNFKADYKIAFEPNPIFFPVLSQKDIDELHNAIVWDKDEIIEFSLDTNNPPYGSTAIKSKKTWETGKKIEAHAIDFSDFILDLHGRLEASKILVKMDIEGSEFRVLERLNKNGSDKLIYKIYVETHENKVPEYTGKMKDELLEKMNCEVIEWR